jgi:hypothetical protein
MSVRVVPVGRPEVASFEMPDRFRHDITYFVTSPGESGAPAKLGENEWWVRREDAQEFYDDGILRIVSPLDSQSTAELEITEEQEAWLRWMIDNRIEHIRLA